jgi:hypothetical protein
MSEYQYYEFQTVDQPLTKKEQEIISKLSSRVKLTPSKAIFTYSYSDFPGNAEKILAQYFDAMFYIANWGTVELMFRFPLSLISVPELEKYSYEDFIKIWSTGDYLIVKIEWNDEEGGGWIEEDAGYLDSLIGLRQQILEQDYRVLYLAWLKAIDSDYEPYLPGKEPPIPSGLNDLSEPLIALIEVLEIDEDLVKVAATNSNKITIVEENILTDGISQLSESEKDDFLLRLAQGEGNLSLKLKQKLLKLSNISLNNKNKKRRTIKELLEETQKFKQKEKLRKEQEAKKKKIKELTAFAKQENETWLEVYSLIQKGQSQPYDEAKKLLVKLKDLAFYQGQEAEFYQKIKQLKEQYPRRTGLLRRLNQL